VIKIKKLTLAYLKSPEGYTNPENYIWLKMDKLPITCSCEGNSLYLNYYSKKEKIYNSECKDCGGRIGFTKKILKAIGFLPLTNEQINNYK